MKNSTAAVDVACAIIFLIFVFLYVFCFQADLLTLAQHVWSGGKTHFNPLVGSLSFCAVLFLIYYGVKTIFPLPPHIKALSYFPSLLFLGVITCVSPKDAGGLSVGNWWWISSILLILFFIFIRPFSELTALDIKVKSTSLVSRVAWCNYLILFVLFMIVSLIGNCNRDLHRDLHVENLVDNHRYSDALDIAKASNATDSTLTMLRALALSKENRLGEDFFSYPVTGGSMSLVPHADHSSEFLFADAGILWRTLGAIPRCEITNVRDFLLSLRRHKVARHAVNDYLLTAYLLDKDLNGFAKELLSQMDTVTIKPYAKGKELDSLKHVKSETFKKNMSNLPRHYREALVLYNHVSSKYVLSYRDDVVNADYEDFFELSHKKYKSPEERMSALQDSYSGTYWIYYYKIQ